MWALLCSHVVNKISFDFTSVFVWNCVLFYSDLFMETPGVVLYVHFSMLFHFSFSDHFSCHFSSDTEESILCRSAGAADSCRIMMVKRAVDDFWWLWVESRRVKLRNGVLIECNLFSVCATTNKRARTWEFHYQPHIILRGWRMLSLNGNTMHHENEQREIEQWKWNSIKL